MAFLNQKQERLATIPPRNPFAIPIRVVSRRAIPPHGHRPTVVPRRKTPRFGVRRHVAMTQSGDMSPHSKFSSDTECTARFIQHPPEKPCTTGRLKIAPPGQPIGGSTRLSSAPSLFSNRPLYRLRRAGCVLLPPPPSSLSESFTACLHQLVVKRHGILVPVVTTFR